jgi:hypothetical protein
VPGDVTAPERALRLLTAAACALAASLVVLRTGV